MLKGKKETNSKQNKKIPKHNKQAGNKDVRLSLNQNKILKNL